MGLLGRKKKQDDSQPHASAEAQTEFAARKGQEPVAETGETSARATRATDETLPLEAGTGLYDLVQLMRQRGQGQLTLSLQQSGGDMNLRLYNDGEELDSTVVIPGSDWFAPVAALYTEETQGERGEWNRALVVLNPPVGSEIAVQVSLLNTNERTSYNLKYLLAGDQVEQTTVSKLPAEESAPVEPVAEEPAVEEPTEPTDAVAETEVSEPANSQQLTSASSPYPTSADYVCGVPVTGVNEILSKDAVETAKAEAVASESSEGQLLEVPETLVAEESDGELIEAEPEVIEEVVEGEQPAEQAALEAASEQSRAEKDLPAHIDDWAIDEDTFASVPATADQPDVAAGVCTKPIARPSSKKLAKGNLVLSEAEVYSRLGPAQEALFGAEGRALDAATVLVRIRTLGSYYDALTHVRRNGFWVQEKTFDLIPEEILKVLELKAASYKEGAGSPLAISLRFTPGIPPVASFDYANEEAFVQYSDQLPAQQYIEELRMFPRTGANIPPHMSEALASWAL